MKSFMATDPIYSNLLKPLPIVNGTNSNLDNSNTGDPDSYAYPTARNRWPKIWSSAIEDVKATIAGQHPSLEDKAAGHDIISKLDNLQSALANDAALEPIPADGSSDINAYNEELRSLGPGTWLAAPWLFAECYIYRLVHTFFSTSTPFWQAHDIFFAEKQQSLVASHVGVFEIVKRFADILQSFKNSNEHGRDEDIPHILFDEMIQIALWGNATDLTMLKSLAADEMQSRQGKTARETSRANIVVNDTEKVWQLLSTLKAGSSPSSGIIHIVLDNAGFELLADLVLASYVLENKFASKIVLHGKAMPWFVSDVNARDLESLVECFANGTYPTKMDPVEKQQIKAAGAYWQSLLDHEKITFYAHPFWTTQHCFGRMAVFEPDLFNELAQSDLVIFKGDLNYRKLTYDGQWPKTTTFNDALGLLAKPQDGKAIRVLVLRTCKSDVCVGLNRGQEEALEDGWTRYGHYGVVSYWDGKAV